MATMERVRADVAIRDDVLADLEWNPRITKPTQIGVAVNDGVVTLAGTTTSYAEKVAAEKAAKRVLGVKAVANEVQVKLPMESTRIDTDIAAAAASALEWDSTARKGRVKVTVQDGWITLEGNADWYYQREAAERDVCYLWGVRGVTNLITVAAHKVPPLEVKEKIEQALKRNAELNATRLHVESQDGKIILTGTVRSWAERRETEMAPWSTQGVTTVENRIDVSPYA